MKKIQLVRELGSNVVTRHSLDRLFSKIRKYKSKELLVDFNKVDFVSRSGADEYLKLKNSTNKVITEANMSDEVRDMFEVVASPDQIKFNMTPVKIVNI